MTSINHYLLSQSLGDLWLMGYLFLCYVLLRKSLLSCPSTRKKFPKPFFIAVGGPHEMTMAFLQSNWATLRGRDGNGAAISRPRRRPQSPPPSMAGMGMGTGMEIDLANRDNSITPRSHSHFSASGHISVPIPTFPSPVGEKFSSPFLFIIL